MNPKIKIFRSALTNPWFLVINGWLCIAALLWFIYGQTSQSPSTSSYAALVITFTLLSVGYFYSIRIRLENIALRGISAIFFEINQIYQRILRDQFYSSPQDSSQLELIKKEEQVLKAVCQRISAIFSRVTNRDCMVTVKLVTLDEGKLFAHTYVRSQELCSRDMNGRENYQIGTGENNGFDIALSNRKDGSLPHFFSADLRESHFYTNLRKDYLKHYKSTLLVPIQGGRDHGLDSNAPTLIHTDLIGFLCIDTLSVNRLNNNYHLFMLSALASQMYNFMSLMRGRYVLGAEINETR